MRQPEDISWSARSTHSGGVLGPPRPRPARPSQHPMAMRDPMVQSEGTTPSDYCTSSSLGRKTRPDRAGGAISIPQHCAALRARSSSWSAVTCHRFGFRNVAAVTIATKQATGRGTGPQPRRRRRHPCLRRADNVRPITGRDACATKNVAADAVPAERAPTDRKPSGAGPSVPSGAGHSTTLPSVIANSAGAARFAGLPFASLPSTTSMDLMAVSGRGFVTFKL